MNQRNLNELALDFERHHEIALVCHVSPDGDTLGSALALLHVCDKLGKVCRVYCQDDVPQMYSFLPGVDRVTPYCNQSAQGLLVIFIDTSDDKRVGNCIAICDSASKTYAIDHHVTHVPFTNVSIVEPDASATAIVMIKLIDRLCPMDETIASCLYTAISTDTGNFNFANTNSSALTAAARCVDAGANVEELSLKLFRLKSRARIRLMQIALKKMSFVLNDKVALVALSKSDYDKCGASDGDGEGIVSYIMEIEGVVAAVFARELNDKIKFSLRSCNLLDVSKVANQFGGGGHKQAAGVTLVCDMESAVGLITNAIEDEMREVNLWTDI